MSTPRVCLHHRDPLECEQCIGRAAAAAAVGLPDIAAGIHRDLDAQPCGCCPLPIEPGEPTALTPGGEIVHAGCATPGGAP